MKENKENKQKKIKGVRRITMNAKKFILEYPILETILVKDDNGEIVEKKAYSRSAIADAFNDSDTISFLEPTANEYYDITKRDKDNVDIYSAIDFRINDEEITLNDILNKFSYKEFTDLNRIIGAFLGGRGLVN